MSDESDWQSILKAEYEGAKNSFIFRLRCGSGWDKNVYLKLSHAMLECCEALCKEISIPRWITEVFWHLDFYARYDFEHTKQKSDYHETAITILNHFAWWFFTGSALTEAEFETLSRQQIDREAVDTSDWQSVLKAEYESEENSFLFQLRYGRGWDKNAYLRLFDAMLECCKIHDGQAQIERWIAFLFWRLDNYSRSELEGKSDIYKSDYYENAVTNLNHLAWWLFAGVRRTDDRFEPLSDET